MSSRKRRLVSVLGLLLLALPILGQPLVEEDLEEPDIYEDLLPIFERAEGLFNSPDQPDSVAVIDELLQEFEALRAVDPPTEEAWGLVTQALFMRVQANFNLGFNEVAEVDLGRILEIEPAFALDRGLVSSKVVDLFEGIQRNRIGLLELQLEPTDATAFVGRWVADEEGILQLPAGEHRLTVERPGYATLERPIEIAAGKSESLEIVLERVSAVLTVLSSDEAVEVYLDGRLVGQTAFDPEAPDDLAVAVLQDLDVGSYDLEARKLGFRTYQRRAEIPELADYRTGPIELERTAAEVVLQNFPAGTVVRANDALVTPDFSGGRTTLTLSPGNYLLAFSNPDRGLFETQFALADRDVKEVDVQLRPAITFLGVLGSDRQAADALSEALRTELVESSRWALIDRTGSADEIAAAASLDLADLRSGPDSPLPWDVLQREADARLSSSLFLMAVLTDDLLADEAILYVWPAAPLPAQPDILLRKLGVDDGGLSRLDDDVIETIPVLGAVLFDSPVGDGAIVYSSDAGTAADRSGLRAGDRVVAIDGEAVSTVAELRQGLRDRISTHAATGRTVPLGIERAGTPTTLDLQMETGHRIRGVRDPDLMFSAAGVSLSREIERSDSETPRWALDLQLAIVHLRGNDLEGAIRILRAIEAPSQSGLGTDMVSYTLARALQQAGGSYSAAARQFLEGILDSTTARLGDADGPYLAPRARARLLTLE